MRTTQAVNRKIRPAPPSLLLGVLVLELIYAAVPVQACDCGIQIGSGSVLSIGGSVSTDCVEVDAGGYIYIRAGGKLTLRGAPCSTSIVDGQIILEGSGSELAFVDNDHMVIGTGRIEGRDDAAKITIASGVTLSSSVTIQGAMEIADATEDGTFVNQGKVRANRNNGLLKLSVSTVCDSAATGAVSSSNYRWGVDGTGTCELRFEVSSSVLIGPFYVHRGVLQTGSDLGPGINICTTGNILFDGGAIVAKQGCSISFGGTCL